tara:strand:+ start:151 stop:288 length:138 start_codon:yes stop_codon:yes gene_type:complete
LVLVVQDQEQLLVMETMEPHHILELQLLLVVAVEVVIMILMEEMD